MSGIDLGVWRECVQQLLEAADERPMVPSRKVCAADGLAEQAVAGEEHALRLAIETDASWRVSRTGNDLQGVCAEGDGRVLCERFARRGQGTTEGHSQEVLVLAIEPCEHREVGSMAAGFQAIGLFNPCGTKDMVEMGMGQQMRHGVELLGGDMVLYGCIFSGS